MAYIDNERIAEIKNALTVIHLNAQLVPGISFSTIQKMMGDFIEQVKRIDGLLPKIKYEKKGEKGENH